MSEQEKVINRLKELDIEYEIHFHPPLPTIEEAMEYWQDIDATHCKNLFFRNHKGNRHYLVILEHTRQLGIRDLEQRLRQGKISFASEKRMKKFLGITGGSVSLFGIINDEEKHVYLFLDQNLQDASKISFHPNDNSATVVITKNGFMKFLSESGNSYEFLQLYD